MKLGEEGGELRLCRGRMEARKVGGDDMPRGKGREGCRRGRCRSEEEGRKEGRWWGIRSKEGRKVPGWRVGK